MESGADYAMSYVSVTEFKNDQTEQRAASRDLRADGSSVLRHNLRLCVVRFRRDQLERIMETCPEESRGTSHPKC